MKLSRTLHFANTSLDPTVQIVFMCPIFFSLRIGLSDDIASFIVVELTELIHDNTYIMLSLIIADFNVCPLEQSHIV